MYVTIDYWTTTPLQTTQWLDWRVQWPRERVECLQRTCCQKMFSSFASVLSISCFLKLQSSLGHRSIYPFTHDGNRATTQGAGLCTESSLGFSVLPKDTVTRGQENLGIKLPTLIGRSHPLTPGWILGSRYSIDPLVQVAKSFKIAYPISEAALPTRTPTSTTMTLC